MQMDIYWIAVGGKDPLEYFRRYPGRFPLVHVKDLKWNRAEPVPPGTATHGVAPSDERPSPEMTEAGSGEIDWKRIFEQSDLAGIEHTIVEHDRPSSAFDSIKTSYRYLSGLRF
jgi:sugar phosphate isomerase/epimerase